MVNLPRVENFTKKSLSILLQELLCPVQVTSGSEMVRGKKNIIPAVIAVKSGIYNALKFIISVIVIRMKSMVQMLEKYEKC
jgi:hypothetical protein